MGETLKHSPFRNPGATNQEGTCLWCGRKLRQKYHFDYVNGRPAPESRFKFFDKPGDYGDGYFCGLRCGFDFGVAMASFGRRIKPITPAA